MNDSGGTSSTTPGPHTLDSNDPNDVPAGQILAIGPFAFPAGTIVTYTVVDTPTGVGSDTMDVVVAPDAEIQSGATQITGFGTQTNISSATGTTQGLPEDSYDLVIICHNFLDDCLFELTLVATY
jgi:hypothetical protein